MAKKQAPRPAAKKAATKKAAPKSKSGRGKQPDLWLLEEDGERKSLTRSAFERKIAGETGAKKPVVSAMIDMVWKGEDFDPDPDADPDTQKLDSLTFETVENMVAEHERITEEVADEQAQAEAEKAAAAEAAKKRMELAVPMTREISRETGQSLNSSLVAVLQGSLGDSWEVHDRYVTPKKGATITEDDIVKGATAALGVDDSLDAVRGSNMLRLGDICLAAETLFDDGANLIAQIAEATGKAKHTIRQAINVCSFFAPDTRPVNLSFTHLQEHFNYREPAKIAAADMTKWRRLHKAVLDKTIKGEPGNEITVEIDGKKIKSNRPLSCARQRELYQEAVEKITSQYEREPEDEKPEEAETGAEEAAAWDELQISDLGYLYVDYEGKVFKSDEFNEEAAALCYVVIDLAANTTVAADGGEGDGIESLDPAEGNWPAESTSEEATAAEETEDGEDPEIPE